MACVCAFKSSVHRVQALREKPVHKTLVLVIHSGHSNLDLGYRHNLCPQ